MEGRTSGEQQDIKEIQTKMLYLSLTLSLITQNVKLLSSTLKDYTQTILKDNTQINRMDKRTKSTMYYIKVM